MAGSSRIRNDHLLLAALLAGLTVADAAKQASISERTAYKRLADPAFRERLADLQRESIKRTEALIGTLSAKAVATLEASLEALSEPVRVSAAKTILELRLRYRESGELEDVLAELEAELPRKLRRVV